MSDRPFRTKPDQECNTGDESAWYLRNVHMYFPQLKHYCL